VERCSDSSISKHECRLRLVSPLVTAPTEARGRSARSTETAKRGAALYCSDHRHSIQHMAPGDAGGAVIELLNDASGFARYSVWRGLSQTDQQIGTGRLFIRRRVEEQSSGSASFQYFMAQ